MKTESGDETVEINSSAPDKNLLLFYSSSFKLAGLL